jgi:hypothetical protein
MNIPETLAIVVAIYGALFVAHRVELATRAT